MADRVLITTDDLEPAVRLNAQLEAAAFETALTSNLDDLRQAVERRAPDCIVVTGGLHETAASHILALARDRSRLASLRAKILKNRFSEPLFDTGRYTRNLETALKVMSERQRAGLQPATFVVAE